MKAQRARAEVELHLHPRDDFERRLPLGSREPVAPLVKIADHLEHERAGDAVPVVARGARGRLIPVAPRPDHPFRVDRYVLGDVAPAILFGVEPPHRLDRLEPAKLAVIRPPRVMHMDGVDLPPEGETREQLRELFQRKTIEWPG